MVNYLNPRLDGVFGALADPTRRGMLEILGRAECCVTDLAGSFPMSLPAISKHLRVLEKAGLIARRREGRQHHLRVAGERMKEATEWMEQYRGYWGAQLDSLALYLEKNPVKPDKPHLGEPSGSKKEERNASGGQAGGQGKK